MHHCLQWLVSSADICLLHLEFRQIDVKLLCHFVDTAHLIHSLDCLGTNTKLDLAIELLREESLPLQIHMLDLLDASV